MDDEPIVKTPKTWTADQRYELFGTDRYLNLWLNRGFKRRFPAWHFEYEGFSGRVKAVFHDERVLIEIHGYKEESGSTFGFKLRWKVPRRLRGKDVMVWGDPVYPWYLGYDGRRENEQFRVVFDRTGHVTAIEQEVS